MLRPAWRDYQGLHTLTRTIEGVLRVAQVTRYGSQWKIRVFRADEWGTAVNKTTGTKREAKRLGELALDLTPTPDLVWTPTLAQLRANVRPLGVEIVDDGDRYEAFAPEGSCFSGDLHALVATYDEGDLLSKQAARRDLFEDLKQDLEPCDPDSENCRACGCFPEKD